MIERLKGYRNTNEQLVKDGIVLTYKGRYYDLVNFTEEMVDKEFIINSLCNQVRFLGNTVNKADRKFRYSIGQHCVIGSHQLILMGKPKEALAFLYHEREEAYTGDIISPLKHLVKEIVKPIIDNISKITGEWLQLPKDVDYDLIKMVDLNLYEWESMIFQFSSLNYECWDSETAMKKFKEQENICLEFINYYNKDLVTENNSHNLKNNDNLALKLELTKVSKSLVEVSKKIEVILVNIRFAETKELISRFVLEMSKLSYDYDIEIRDNEKEQLFIIFKFNDKRFDHLMFLDTRILKNFCEQQDDIKVGYCKFIDELLKQK